jgi:hypothetical protein
MGNFLQKVPHKAGFDIKKAPFSVLPSIYPRLYPSMETWISAFLLLEEAFRL